MSEPLIVGTNGNVAAIEPTTGQVKWRTELKTGSFLSSTGGQDVTVLVKGEIVFAGCMGHLFCIDATSGAVLWHNSLEGFGHNDIAMAMEGVAVHVVAKVQRSGHKA